MGALLRHLPGTDRRAHRRWRSDRRIPGRRAMTLGDLRKIAIRKQFKIRFALRNGMECVIGEDGVARVPALKAQPDFKLEDEFDAADKFVVEQVIPAGQKNPPKATTRS